MPHSPARSSSASDVAEDALAAQKQRLAQPGVRVPAGELSSKLDAFLRTRGGEVQTPCLVLDVDIAAQNYVDLVDCLPSNTRVFYAVKVSWRGVRWGG